MPVLLFHAASEVCLIRCGHCSLVCPLCKAQWLSRGVVGGRDSSVRGGSSSVPAQMYA